jgi:peptidoglycan/LPS O-acetylase OafA/YrhL
MSLRGETYRADIDGLRAIAVLAVVLYHAGVPGFSGGFVGVDIFFVISGYLITGIVAREIAAGQFSLLNFYERRIRRIFPALFVMLAFSALAALIIHLPAELQEFSRSLIAAALFVSNIFFWQTADYFAGPSHLKPLLHTWSLAVEEQFYIVFPVMLMALARFARARFLMWLVPITLLSLMISIWATDAKPVAAFYLLPARLWELMVGALLALGAIPAIRRAGLREAAGFGGMVLIILSIALYSSAVSFPGLAALIPCLGAALVIHAGTSGSNLMSRILGVRPLVVVGLMSYSLYLWHWPLLAFARQARGEPLGALEIGYMLAASFFVAALSWRFIEQPVRARRVLMERSHLFASAAAATLGAAAFAASALLGAGWPMRHPRYDPVHIAGRELLKEGTCFLRDDQSAAEWAGIESCTSGPATAPMILLWGDSYAAHLASGLEAEAAGRWRIVTLTASGCPPVLGVHPANRPHCRTVHEDALALMAQLKPDVVVMSARWAMYVPRVLSWREFAETLSRVRATGAKLALVAQSPNFDFLSAHDFIYRTGREQARVTFPLTLNDEMKHLAPSDVIDPMPLYCRGAVCDVRRNGAYLYFDDGHLTLAGSRILAQTILARLPDPSRLSQRHGLTVTQ